MTRNARFIGGIRELSGQSLYMYDILKFIAIITERKLIQEYNYISNSTD